MVVWASMVLILAIYVLSRIGPQLGPVRVETHVDIEGLPGQIIIALTLLLFEVALFRLSQMLGSIADGPLFGLRVTGAFRGFAFWLFLAALLNIFAGPAMELIRLAGSGGGRTELQFGLRDLLMLLGAFFLFLLARMMEQARAIESELEEIV
jgi:hypothetical protein